MEQFKRCSKCSHSLPANAFYKNRHTKDGLSYWCKACTLADCARYRKLHSDQTRQAYREWAKEHHNTVKEICRRYRDKYPERIARYYETRLVSLREATASLTDSVVLGYLRKSTPELRGCEIPTALIEAKRAHLKVLRYLKEHKA